MKIFTGLLLLVIAIATQLFGMELPDVLKHASCSYCGMDRNRFSHSRMLINYDDGSETAVCSLHCAAVDLANHIDKTPRQMFAGDYRDKKLIDAEKAVWVIGGSKPGIMTATAKWAFGEKKSAEDFIAAQGGRLATFDDAVRAAYEDMYRDTKQIRERRKAKKLQNSSGSSR